MLVASTPYLQLMLHVLRLIILASSASFLNPINWVKEKLVPTLRERQPQAEVEARKKQAAEAGQVSVFDTVPTPARQKPTKRGDVAATAGGYVPRKPTKPRPSSVRGLFRSGPEVLTLSLSINTLQQTSKSRTESSTCLGGRLRANLLTTPFCKCSSARSERVRAS